MRDLVAIPGRATLRGARPGYPLIGPAERRPPNRQSNNIKQFLSEPEGVSPRSEAGTQPPPGAYALRLANLKAMNLDWLRGASPSQSPAKFHRWSPQPAWTKLRELRRPGPA